MTQADDSIGAHIEALAHAIDEFQRAYERRVKIKRLHPVAPETLENFQDTIAILRKIKDVVVLLDHAVYKSDGKPSVRKAPAIVPPRPDIDPRAGR